MNQLTAESLPGTVLVTGGNGNIGRSLCEQLVCSGIDVVALDLTFAESHGERGRQIDYRKGDVTDEALVAAAMRGVDAVVHLAAIPHPSLGTPYQVFATNVVGTFNVLNQAASQGIQRAVIASSINAVGIPMNPHQPLPAHFPLDETTPPDIADWYSLSKATDELTAAMAARRWGMGIFALRFPLTADRETLLHAAARARGDLGTNLREGWSYLDVRDAVDAIERCLAAPPFVGINTLLLAADDSLLDRPTLQALSGIAPGVTVRGKITPQQSLVDTSRARQAIGFAPRHSIHRPDSLPGIQPGNADEVPASDPSGAGRRVG